MGTNMTEARKDWNFQHDDDWENEGEHEDDGDHNGHGHHGHWGGDDFDSVYQLPKLFKLDLSDFNLKKFGKITDFDIDANQLSVTLGNKWTLAIEGHDFDVTFKGKMPVISGGVIDSFTIDGPGKADFSISGLDMSAKAIAKALLHFDTAKLVNLVLGGGETISGSGFGDYIFAGKGNDHVLGNAGNDWLKGGAGDDVINGGTGNDYLHGGDGADTFAFSKPSGLDLIADFDVSEDVLDLSALGFDGSFDDFLEENLLGDHGDHGKHNGWDKGNHYGWGDDRCDDDAGDGVVIDLGGGDKVKLDGVSRWDLDDQNILL